MATLGNERYLRHIWLLGEGGLLVLRGIVTKETALSGQPLEHILANKRSLFNNILREQKLALFPTSSTVNQDVNTWDMSLLLLVIKRIFWSYLSPADQTSIETLKTYRNNIQGHPTSLSMTENDYDTNLTFLKAAIRQLALGLSTRTKSEIQDIIQKTASGDIDIGSVLGRIKDMHEFKTTLQSLENNFDHVNTTLSEINSSLRDMAVSSEKKSCENKENQERMLHIISNIEKMTTRSIVDQKSKELETIVQATCGDQEKQKKAIALLYSVIEIVQIERPFSESEIKTMIVQRIQWHGELTLKLIEDVINWFKDINNNPDTSVGKARLGSIRLPISCSSVGGLLMHIDYMNGSESQGRLLEMSSKMSQQLGFSCHLSWSYVSESLQDVLRAFDKSLEPSKLVLPFQTTSMKGLQNIWKMFGGEKKNVHLLRISETLSNIFKINIRLTSAVDRDQFQTTLFESAIPEENTTDRSKPSRIALAGNILEEMRLDHSKEEKLMTMDTSKATRRAPPTVSGFGAVYPWKYEKKETKPAMESEKLANIPEDKRDVGTGRSQVYEKKDIKSKNRDEKLAYRKIQEPYTHEAKTTDTSETITRASHLLLPLHSEETEEEEDDHDHDDADVTILSEEEFDFDKYNYDDDDDDYDDDDDDDDDGMPNELQTDERKLLKKKSAWSYPEEFAKLAFDDNVPQQNVMKKEAKQKLEPKTYTPAFFDSGEFLPRRFVKKDTKPAMESKTHAYTQEKTALESRQRRIGKFRRGLSEYENRYTKEEIDDKTHTFSPEERKSDNFFIRLKEFLNKRSTKTESEDKAHKYATEERKSDDFLSRIEESYERSTKTESEDKAHKYTTDESPWVLVTKHKKQKHKKTATSAEIPRMEDI